MTATDKLCMAHILSFALKNVIKYFGIVYTKTHLYTQNYTTTVETRYNAVLGVHRSDPRYIRVDGYNAVYVPPPAHEWPVSVVDRLIL